MTDTNPRPRVRDIGIATGRGEPGPHNAITDVPGVRVGHVTLVHGSGPLIVGRGPVRTGVTAVVPPGDNWFSEPLEAACYVFNGAGTTAGLSLIDECARIETPVMLTNTLSVGAVYDGVVAYMVDHVFRGADSVPWFNPVVGETADGYLNDLGGRHVRPEHAAQAIRTASSGPVPEGNVGAGTGTRALGYKAGIGTASRALHIASCEATVGVLVQSNFGGELTIAGIPIPEPDTRHEDPARYGSSIMIVLATDLPLSGRLLGRVAKRATFGLARTGSSAGHGSGDYVIAFSTTHRKAGALDHLRETFARDEGEVDAAFVAVADATEEAILNSLFAAETMTGRDENIAHAVEIDRVVEVLEHRGAL